MLNKRPKKLKYNKSHKGRYSFNLPILKQKILKKKNKQDYVQFCFLLIAEESCRLTASQLGAGELTLKRTLKNVSFPSLTFQSTPASVSEETNNSTPTTKKNKKIIQIITHIFPHIPVTKKPAEVRMGKGKGSVDYFMHRLSIGTPIYELRFNFVNIPSQPTNLQNSDLSINNEISDQLNSLQTFCSNLVNSAFKITSSKLPIKTKIISY